MIPMHHGIEQHRERALRLPAPHRADAEQHHAAAPDRRVDHRGPPRHLAAVYEQARDEEGIGLVMETEDDASALALDVGDDGGIHCIETTGRVTALYRQERRLIEVHWERRALVAVQDRAAGGVAPRTDDGAPSPQRPRFRLADRRVEA